MKTRMIILALTMIASASKSSSNRCYATQLITRIQKDENVRAAWTFVESIQTDEPRLSSDIHEAMDFELECARRKCDDFCNFCNCNE